MRAEQMMSLVVPQLWKATDVTRYLTSPWEEKSHVKIERHHTITRKSSSNPVLQQCIAHAHPILLQTRIVHFRSDLKLKQTRLLCLGYLASFMLSLFSFVYALFIRSFIPLAT